MSSSTSVPVPTDFNKYLYTTLAEADPEVAKIVEDETWRQFSGLELIASEVSRGAWHVMHYVTRGVLQEG